MFFVAQQGFEPYQQLLTTIRRAIIEKIKYNYSVLTIYYDTYMVLNAFARKF